MKIDDAYYHLLLLRVGLDDGYDEWLNGYLEAEDPLSDIVLNLALCGSDLNQTISCLNAYCGWKPEVDERQLCDRLRLFLKNAYHGGQMDQRAVVKAMYRLSLAHGDPWDFECDLWDDFYYMEDRLALVEDGFASREVFDRAFHEFLNEGISLEVTVWEPEKKPSRMDGIRNGIKRLWTILRRK